MLLFKNCKNMTWEIFKGTEEDWQRNFVKSKKHYRQSYNWGEYKSMMNWKILRLEKIDELGKKTLVQITYKKKFIFCAAYIPGDIAGDINHLDNSFKKKIMEVSNSKFLYIRLDSNSINYEKEFSILKKINGTSLIIEHMRQNQLIVISK